MDDLRSEVIRKLNIEFGSDIKSLSKCHELSKTLEEEKKSIANCLSLASDEVPSKVAAALRSIEETSTEINTLAAKYDLLSCDVQSQLMKAESSTSKIQEYIEQINLLERTIDYLRCVEDVEELSNGLTLSIMENDNPQSVEYYVTLCDLYKRLENSDCCHLVEFLKKTIHFWHNQLKDKFSGEFDEVLLLIKWPIRRTDSVLFKMSPEALQKFQLICEYLLQINLPDDLLQIPTVTSALMVDFVPPSLPVGLLLRPLRKRFLYHFYGSRQTNKIDKPEWYFTQALNWVRDLENFVQLKVQPVMNKLGMQRKSAKTELTVGIVQLVVEKLQSDLPALMLDDVLFAHAIDETLAFAKELVDGFNYPPNQPTVIGVLTQASVFVKWILIEKKFASEKMDNMLNSESAWLTLGSPDLDEHRITECGETFLRLLLTMTDRCGCLPQPGHRLQFLELQLELLDDFRVRLLQLLHEEPPDPLTSRLPAILNTVSYVASVLVEWGAQTHFLHLQFHKLQFESAGSHGDNEPAFDGVEGSVFDDTLSLYIHMRDDLLNTVCDSVMLEIMARSRQYRKDKWFAMPSPKELINPTLTPSVCPMFQVLATKLHQLKEGLSSSLFVTAWIKVAKQLNQFIYEEVILQNCFNDGGAMQFQFDMTRNLFPLFAQFTSKPDSHFPEVKESCVLLNLPKGLALLLRETLMGTQVSTRPDFMEPQGTDVLADVGVQRLPVEKALAILNSRTDFSHL